MMTLQLRDNVILTLDRSLVWRSEASAVADRFNREYTRAWWKARHEPMVAARQPAFELAYMVAEELDAEVIGAPDDWGMLPTPEGAVQ